ncbi:MAG TPA: hypothetical protein V6C64_12695 [Microcoleaceae cyanobacterium]|jgi:hypothetical protein
MNDDLLQAVQQLTETANKVHNLLNDEHPIKASPTAIATLAIAAWESVTQVEVEYFDPEVTPANPEDNPFKDLPVPTSMPNITLVKAVEAVVLANTTSDTQAQAKAFREIAFLLGVEVK